MIPAREPYDPTWAVKAFRNRRFPIQEPEETILKNLEKCKEVVGYCDCGCGDPYFIDPDSDEWNSMTTLLCMIGTKAVILDVLTDLRVGAIETFDLDALHDRPSYPLPDDPSST